jgi:hypothetical protein
MRKFSLTILAAAMTIAFSQTSAHAQDAILTINKAQRTLDAIEQLLDSIKVRLASANSANSGGMTADGWESLFDGKSLGMWKRTNFGGEGEVTVEPSFRGGPPAIVVKMGASLSGFNWTGDVPRTNYEISLETLKIDGSDFLCGLTFPVEKSYASLILGGWGGGVVGISSIDMRDASENDTTKYMSFAKDKWFKVRVRVTPDKLEAWLDGKQVVDQEITGKQISLRPGDIMKSIPLGISTYQTSAAYRDIKLRKLK